MWRIVSAGLYLALGSIYDIKKRVIPLWLPVAFGVGTAILGLIAGGSELSPFGGAAAGGAVILVGYFTGWKIGPGDGISMALLGLLLGASKAFGILLCGVFFCGIAGIGLIILKRGSLKTRLPLLPFLGLGLIIDCLITQGMIGG